RETRSASHADRRTWSAASFRGLSSLIEGIQTGYSPPARGERPPGQTEICGTVLTGGDEDRPQWNAGDLVVDGDRRGEKDRIRHGARPGRAVDSVAGDQDHVEGDVCRHADRREHRHREGPAAC